MRKPTLLRKTPTNLLLFVIMHHYKSFWRVMRKPATKRNNSSNVHFVFGRVMRTPAFPRINASNIRDFGASWENLLFYVKLQQFFFPFCNNASYIRVFGRVMRKPAFPRNNASNIRVFSASWENLLFHVILQQICPFMAHHEKTCFST